MRSFRLNSKIGRRGLILGSGALALLRMARARADEAAGEVFEVTHSPDEWRAILGPDRYAVLREAAAIHSITDWLDEWFDSAANVSGEMPKRSLLAPYAKKIYDHLKNRPSPEGR